MFWIKDILRTPEDEGVTGSTASVVDDVNVLNDEGSEEVVEEEPEASPVEEAEELEEKPEEEPEEKPQEINPIYDRPTIKQINEKFPDFFKKFPSMRDMYFREAEYSKVFPTIEDAKEASENNEVFSNIREDVFKGSIDRFLYAVKESDPKALDKIAENILPNLNKISPDAHLKATLPLMQNIVKAAFIEGKRTGNENLMHAAEHLSNYLFNDHEIASSGKSLIKPPEQDDRVKEIEDREKSYEVRRFQDFDNSVRTDGATRLQELVLEKNSEGKDKIDPEGVLSEFVRNAVIEKVIKQVNDQMLADRTFQAQMQKLWVNSKRNGYDADSKSRILSAFLARAKSLIPAIRAKLVSEALGTSSKIHARKREIAENSNSRKETGSSGRDVRGGNKSYNAKAIDWSKTSDLDLLDDKVTFKK